MRLGQLNSEYRTRNFKPKRRRRSCATIAVMDTKIQVEIYGQPYQIRAGANSEYIRSVAGYVDLKMREIASATPTVDSLKIAVLAALNITDEFFQLKMQTQDVDREFERRTERMNQILDSI